MKDILGQEIKVGDIVAHGQREANSGRISVKIVIEARSREHYSRTIDEVKVIGYRTLRWNYNKETKSGEYENGMFVNDHAGWTTPDVLLVVNDSVPKKIKEFLQSQL